MSAIINIHRQNIVLTIFFFNSSYLAERISLVKNLKQVFKIFFVNLLVCEI